MVLQKIRLDEWMVIVFLVIWIIAFWTFGNTIIFTALSGESPTSVLGFPANVAYAIAVTAVITLLPWVFTRHINFEEVRSPETDRDFKWIPDSEEE